MSLSIKALGTAFPKKIIDNSYFSEELYSTNNPMFLGTKFRRHIGREQGASDLIAAAVSQVIDQTGINRRTDIDVLLTNVTIPDEAFTGCGAVVCKKTGLKVSHIVDLHNTGCVSFLFMLDLANSLMRAHGARSAMICTAQTAGGRIFSQQTARRKAQAAIPGDGCGVTYVTNDGAGGQVLGSVLENFSDYSEDMFGTFDDGRKYWEVGMSEPYIDFNEAKVAQIISRGNELVPAMVRKALAKVGLSGGDITFLVTNQPNLHFLRNWREALELKEAQHLHTFEQYANLFGAAIPITLSENIASDVIKRGDILCLAGFSHAGDYAGATVVRW